MSAAQSSSSKALELQGRHVVVTGASGELGSAVASFLLGAGATCHLPVRSPLNARIAGDRTALHVVEGVDLADERAVAAFFREIPALWASIHCAGAFDARPVAEIDLDHFRSMVHANALSSLFCSREAVGRMRAAGAGGRIVNVLARQALEPERGAGMIAYTMSKAATAALTQALAAEVASEGISVTAVVPSTLDTPKNREAMPNADFASWVKLEDAARAIARLVSPSSTPARGELVQLHGRT